MRRLFFSAALISVLACAGHGKCPEGAPVGVEKPPPANPISTPYVESAPPSTVGIADYEIIDVARDRKIPMRAYIPEGTSPAPLIIFSHGLGSSRTGYSYLGNAWSRAGFVVLHIQHVDSDSKLSLLRLYRASYAPEVWRNRPRDITFVLDALQRHDPLLERVWKRADLNRIGVSGHSLGAQTALNVGGVLMTFRGATAPENFRDARIKAIAQLSVPFLPAARDASHFKPVTVPLLHMTGTKDESPAFDTLLCHKRLPFEWISGPPQWLVTMDGAVHRSFAGEDEAGDAAHIELYHPTIVQFTTAFFDATLRGDEKARDWLDRVAPRNAKVERK